MDLSWLTQILPILFGQAGVGGTMGILFGGYLAWSLYREQESHRETRKQVEAWNEKRLELHSQNLEAISQMRASIQELILAINSRGRR